MQTRRLGTSVSPLPVTINRDGEDAKGYPPHRRIISPIRTFLETRRCRERDRADRCQQSRIYFAVDNAGRRDATTAVVPGSWTSSRFSNIEHSMEGVKCKAIRG